MITKERMTKYIHLLTKLELEYDIVLTLHHFPTDVCDELEMRGHAPLPPYLSTDEDVINWLLGVHNMLDE